MKPLLAFPLLLAAGCGGGATAPAPAEPSSIVEVSDAATLVENVAALKKEAVVLNFWATWCGPCRAEFPEFVRYDREHADDNVEVRFVSLDDAADLPAVRTFLDDHGVTDPSLLYTGQTDLPSELTPGAGVVTTRGHVQWIVTEFGAVNLHGLPLRQRGEALISIAHPDFRAELGRDLAKIRHFTMAPAVARA